jgi:hypothetical protein
LLRHLLLVTSQRYLRQLKTDFIKILDSLLPNRHATRFTRDSLPEHGVVGSQDLAPRWRCYVQAQMLMTSVLHCLRMEPQNSFVSIETALAF